MARLEPVGTDRNRADRRPGPLDPTGGQCQPSRRGVAAQRHCSSGVGRLAAIPVGVITGTMGCLAPVDRTSKCGLQSRWRRHAPTSPGGWSVPRPHQAAEVGGQLGRLPDLRAVVEEWGAVGLAVWVEIVLGASPGRSRSGHPPGGTRQMWEEAGEAPGRLPATRLPALRPCRSYPDAPFPCPPSAHEP